jgi:5'-nucleotidase
VTDINILLVNDDGPTAIGLRVLANAIREVYKGAHLVTITPASSLGGQSMAVTCADLHTFEIKKTQEDCFVVDAKPADLIYLAGSYRERFLRKGRFEMVFSGLNHGANVGMDVYHSGTVGMAMVAAAYLGVGAVAFSKHMSWPYPSEKALSEQLAESERHLCVILESLRLMPGQCLNVNFPIHSQRS